MQWLIKNRNKINQRAAEKMKSKEVNGRRLVETF